MQDENRITGSVLGAVAGGVIGHKVGGGRGKDVATVVGGAGWWICGLVKSRALSRKAILTRLRNSVVKRCMTRVRKKCSVMM
ncbi:glycine zipper 2TM domain-containing protein [Shigella flexneri]